MWLCLIIVWPFLNYHKLMDNAIPQTLSRLTPPIDYYYEFVDRQGGYDRFKLKECIYYHQAVAHYFPIQKAESYGMLGFCEERLGQKPQAIAAYKQAIALNPDYFWPYYDVGVIFYNQAQYSKAEDYFIQAIELNPVKTIVLLSRSKVYNDVKLSSPKDHDYLQGLKQGRVSAYVLMMDSLFKTASYVELEKVAISGLKEDLGIDSILYYYAGVAVFYQKSIHNAVELLQAAVQKDPGNADAYYYLGLCLRLAGKPDMAGMLLAKATELHHQQGDNALIKQYLKARVRFF